MRISYLCLLLLGGALAVAPSPVFAQGEGPCTPAAAKPYAEAKGKLRLVLGTGNTGGVFYPYGGGLARIFSSKRPKTEVTAEVTGGSVDNLKLLAKGEADLALSTVDSAYEALQGAGVYKDAGKIPACAVAVLYQSFVHVVALADSGVTTIEGLKGKRVSLGSPGSSTEVLAVRMLEAAGLNPKTDVKAQYLSVSEAAGAAKDGKLDAFFWIGGLPTAAVTDLVLARKDGVRFLDAGGIVDKLRTAHGPIYAAMTLPKTVYGLPADVKGIGVGNVLAVNAAMPEKLVQDLTRIIFDNLDEVKKLHPEAATLSIAGATQGSSIPFHPGAIAVYKEKAAWAKP